VVRRDSGQIDEQRLRTRLRDRLPAYMVPALIERDAELPRFPSGKLKPRLPAAACMFQERKARRSRQLETLRLLI